MLNMQSVVIWYFLLSLLLRSKTSLQITTMKMMFHIDDFKCTLCANWFCPPFNLPYLLPCTHSICTNCLQKASNNDHIICPEDLEACPIQSININLTTKRALQRLMKQHKNYNENTQLQCIKTLSIGFDEVLASKEKQLRNLEALIDQIFLSQIDRLKNLHEKIKIDINRPFKIVEDWKQIVAGHLTSIRKSHSNSNYDSKSNNMLQLNHYIQEGRKMKMQLNQLFQMELDVFADRVMRNPRVCFDKDFNISPETLTNKLKRNTINQCTINSTTIVDKKQSTNVKQIKQLRNESNFKDNYEEPISNNTVLFVSESRKNGSFVQPLGNRDLNKMSISDFHQNENIAQTKRGSHREKNMNMKTSSINANQLANLQKYINFESEQIPHKTSTKTKQNQYPTQYNSKNDRPTLSPGRGKMVEMMRTKNQDKYGNKNLAPKTQTNTSSIQKRSDNLSLSQFQLETISNESELIQKEKQRQRERPFRQGTPNKKRPTQVTQKQSPSLAAFQTSNFNEKMNKLARMLDNTSSHASQQNSTRNSLKTNNKHWEPRIPNSNHHASVENSLLISPNAIRQQYTEQAQQSSIPYEEEQLLNNEDMLITEDKNKQNGWQLGNINFLREWKLKNQNSLEQPLQVRQNTYYYNCEKQKLSYMRKMQIHRVQQALKLTLVKDNYVQLINQSLHDVDMNLYLQQFNWKHSNIEIVKFVKTSLSDEQLNILLNYLVKSNVKALVLSGNNLTQICLDALLNFVTLNNVLKNVYLPKNNINNLRVKGKITMLKEKGVNIYI